MLVGKTQLPAVTWLQALLNIPLLPVKLLGQASAKTLAACGQGIAKCFYFVCTLKGAIICAFASSIAVVYWFYPKESKEYALKSLNATGSLYERCARFAGKY